MSDKDTTPPRTLAERRQRAYERLGSYLDSLPNCQSPEYGPAEREEQERAQRRILDLCADPEDRKALMEFLIGFTGFIGDLRARFVWRESDDKFYLLPTEATEPPTEPRSHLRIVRDDPPGAA